MSRLLALSLLATAAVAFDCTGHIFVAMVGLEQVSGSVINEVTPLFDHMALAFPRISTPGEVACWPDDIKSWTSQYSNWHYYDGCYSVGGYPCPSTPDGMLPTALAAAEQGLANKSLSIAERAFWFAFVLHLVGDAHQPLHLCTQFSSAFPNGDVGGNNFWVDVDGSFTRLHTLLDDGLDDLLTHDLRRPVAANGVQVAEFNVRTLELVHNYSVTQQEATDLSFADWQNESMSICETVVYGSLKNGTAVTSNYTETLRQMLRRQVALGGARLATILQRAFPGPNDAPSHVGTYIAAGVAGGLVIITASAFAAKLYLSRRAASRVSLLTGDDDRLYS